ncbi:hypothetical protein FRACYDRAFT_261221 [Fragilariopsis cylindrus CCMP1102]|uniref:Uncharacterized protein n=1 Tax=Fragilariopsis cylindrus CCMP1102 TaxID=635003 RepID=A0A1E7FDX4_9STRA|nr:hypothetical protein FRACYDRAFT_261221 [Fragilariopsis cylindrus CCMP1102]|eukprot:OEU16382.1 hypothetical protein FRACYDRAFT_261221 [Fragilariopsis cylindrus CCMP1102]
MSTFRKAMEESGFGIRFHDHQQDDIDIDNNNNNDDDDDEATIDVGDKKMIHNTSLSSSSLLPSYTRDGNRSITSYTTECTTDTTRISNTTRARGTTTTAAEKDRNKNKRFFLLFVKILMKLIEEKDDTNIVYQNAQAVIRDCEQRKKRGEIKSFTESLYAPLKETVGIHYWNEARQLLHHNTMLSITTRSPLSTLLCQSTSSMTVRKCNKAPTGNSSREYKVTATMKNNNNNSNSNYNYNNNGNNEEMNIRNKRLWMIISIFMQYLERKDAKLYMKARSLINECVERHRSCKYNCEKYSISSTTSTTTTSTSTSTGTTRTSSLSGSIQFCLKKNIGVDYWRRAESYVAKALLMKHDQNYNKNQMKIKDVVLPGNTTTDVERIITDHHHPISNTTVIKNHRRVSEYNNSNDTTSKRRCFENNNIVL